MSRIGITDLFSSGINFVNTTSNVLQQAGMERASNDLFAFEEQLSKDTNDFLLKLQSENSYDTWDKDVDEYIRNKENLMNQKQDNNLYYMRNTYTAQKGKQILEKQYTDLKNKVSIMKIQKQNEEELVKGQSAKLTIDNNAGYNWITKTEKKGAIDDNNYAYGRTNYSTYIDTRVNDAATTALHAMSNEFDELMEQGFSYEQIKKIIDKDFSNTFEISVLSGSTTPESLINKTAERILQNVDITETKRKLLNEKKSEYNARKNAIYDSNANKLADIVVQMRSATDEIQRLNLAVKGQTAISNLKDNLRESDKLQYSALFDLTKELNTINQKNIKDEKELKKEREQKLKDFMDKAPDTYMQRFFDGTLSATGGTKDLYTANEEFKVAFMNKLDEIYVDESEKKEAANKYMSTLNSFMDTAIGKLLNDTKNHPEFAPVKDKLDLIKKTIEKDQGKYPPDAYAGIVSFCVSTIADNDMSLFKPADLVAELDRVMQLYTGNKIDYMMTDKNNKIKKEIKNAKDLGEALIFFSQPENDIVFTDIKDPFNSGKFINTEYQQAYEGENGIMAGAKKMLADALGIDAGTITGDYQNTENDKKPIPLLKVNGKSYTIQPIDKNGELTTDQKNVKNIQIVDNQGTVIYNEIKKQQQITADKKEKAKATAKLNAERNQKLQNAASTDYQWNNLPKNVQSKIKGGARAWKEMSRDQKLKILKENNLIE